MLKALFAAPLLTLALTVPSSADFWTSGQEDWARHGSRHGAWDCYGRCAGGATPRAHPRAASLMSMQCQQSLQDGRVLVSNGNLLPGGARFRVVTYRPVTRSMGWSNGPCTVAVTR